MFVLKSGKILYFCSGKCYKNYSLGRKGRNTRWTNTAHHLKKMGIAEKEDSERSQDTQSSKDTDDE